jgi:hypothetical protein
MPRRILVVAFAAAMVLLAVGAPATAKGPESATITGPGIGTQELASSTIYPSLDTLTRVTRFWDSVANTVATDTEPPAGELGPRFEVRYHVPDLHNPSSGRAWEIRQDLYPFAAAGPVVYTPRGQTMYDLELPPGWLAVDSGMERLVTQLGGTRTPVETRVEPAAHAETTEAGDGSASADDGSGWIAVTLGAAVALLLAAVIGWRRLRA